MEEILNPEELELEISNSLIKKFITLEELKDFFSQEKTFFDFLRQSSKLDGNLSSATVTVNRCYDDALSRIEQAIGSKSNATSVKNITKTLKTNIESWYRAKQLIYSNSDEGSFLAELNKESPQISGYVYTCISKQQGNISWNNHFAIRGIVEFEIFSRGINEKTKNSTESALEAIRSKTQLHLDEYTSKENELLQRILETKNEINSLLQKKEKEFDDKLNENNSTFSSFHEESEKKLSNINKAYKEHMALKAPVEYWSELKTNSYIRAAVALAISILYILIAGEFVLRKTDKVGLLTQENVTYGKIIYFVILASAFIWILRIIFRYMLGQLHVANESTEKMVMTKTYLALLEDGKLEKSERELVLKSVFRPSGSGLLGDDHPHPAMEIISKIQKPG